MAKTKKTMADHSEDALYREVWEDVRMQKIHDFLRRHMKILIIAAALAASAAIGIVMVRQISHNNKVEIANQYESAMNMTPILSREALSRLAKRTRDGMGDLALFRAYQLAWAAGDRADALAKLEKLAEGGATRDFRDLAVIQLAQLKSGEMSGAAFQKMLSPLLTKRSPFYFTGLLLVAEKYLSENDANEARPFLRKISSDKDAPMSISSAAEILTR
jgi:hypothetical protein